MSAGITGVWAGVPRDVNLEQVNIAFHLSRRKEGERVTAITNELLTF